MTTFRKKATQYLINNGMGEGDAKSVIEIVYSDKDIDFKWDDKTSDFPDAVLNVVLFCVRQTALEWIDANAPKAWYREMFVDKDQVK